MNYIIISINIYCVYNIAYICLLIVCAMVKTCMGILLMGKLL